MLSSPNSSSSSGVSAAKETPPATAGEAPALIVYQDVSKSFDDRVVLKGINLKIFPGETVVILGRSGSGKTVLTSMLVGLNTPDEGSITVMGIKLQDLKTEQDWKELRLKTGYLFQGSALYDSMTVGENVAFPIREHLKLSESEIGQRVAEKLALVGLAGIEWKMPAELSGGMRKRVALARAIALDPDIMLFDEPTTGLDPVLTASIDQLIIETQKRFQMTCVVISHDIQSVFRIAHNIVMLHEGRIIEGGPPEVFRQSSNPVIQNFLAGRPSNDILKTDPVTGVS